MGGFTFNTVPSIVFGSGAPTASEAWPVMAKQAMLERRLLVDSARPLTLEDARAIYEAVWQGPR
ncbi:MAG TPA: hypothetical protein VHG30_13225 [Microvirga sp.]|nr:hypothetical protein [Microvirga sp.]